MPKATDFQDALNQILKSAQARGLPYIDVRSGDLHRQVGGYPGSHHRMPVCCSVMRRNIQAEDTILEQPPSGLGASLKIRYKLPRRFTDLERIPKVQQISTGITIPSSRKTTSKDFEEVAIGVMSEYFKTPLTKGKLQGLPKVFDMVDRDGEVAGDAKYLSMVRGERIPPAKFSVISEYVWLLEKTSATHKFLVFGNDRRVPEGWLRRYGSLVRDVVFFFLDEQTRRLEKLNYRQTKARRIGQYNHDYNWPYFEEENRQEIEGIFDCPYCDKSFFSEEELQEHELEHK